MLFGENRETVPPAPEWRVDVGGEFYPEDEGRPWGKRLPFAGTFSWHGFSWKVLGVYSCQDGLVADLGRQVLEEQAQGYLKRWNLSPQGDPLEWAKRLSPAEQIHVERENPFRLDYGIAALADGEALEAVQGSGLLYLPWPEMGESSYQSHWLMDHYGLDRAQCWEFHRQVFSWTQREIRTLALRLWPVFQEFPGSPFQGKAGQCVELENPVTGRTVCLKVLEVGEERGPEEEAFPGFPRMGRWAMPSYFQFLRYTLAPELPEEAFYLRDAARPEEPRCISGGLKRFPAAYGWIGGEAGASRVGSEPARAAYSAPRFAPIESVTWLPVFREKAAGEITVPLRREEPSDA